MFGYHWSPQDRRDSIHKHGLLVPSRHPRLVTPVVCTAGHRNPHISLGKTPRLAWEISGGFLACMGPHHPATLEIAPDWDLWEVDMNQRPGRAFRYWSNGYELQVRCDIGKSRITRVAERRLT